MSFVGSLGIILDLYQVRLIAYDIMRFLPLPTTSPHDSISI
ncbi:hypothetical protein [Fischerella thermalis]